MTWTHRTALAATAAAALILLAGCSAPAPAPQSTEQAQEQLPDGCLTATEGAIQALQDDVTATIGDVTFTGHGVIKSESGDDVWFIALTFDEDGRGRTATWGTMQDPTTESEIAYIAVDDMAPLVSTYKHPASFVGTTSTSVGADDCIPD